MFILYATQHNYAVHVCLTKAEGHMLHLCSCYLYCQLQLLFQYSWLLLLLLLPLLSYPLSGFANIPRSYDNLGANSSIT